MTLKKLNIALAFIALPCTTFAAGLDRSGQSINAFFQEGNYAEAGITVIDPTVKGKSLIKGFEGANISDMAEDYYFPSAALKVQATDHISLALLYDQPFGADAVYQVDTGSLSQIKNAQGEKEATRAEVKTENLTAIIGYQPNQNWNIYAGPVWQTVEADIALRGEAYANSGYNLKVDTEEAYGWLAGFAYQMPEIALRAAVTYRSEIKHKAVSQESFGFGLMPYPLANVEAITPQSVNIDLQTGINPTTLAFANLRWVHWDQFTVTPIGLKLKGGTNLIDYSDDQWSANLGVAHKFSEKWSGTSTVSYDSGAGNPVTTLGPTEGYWGVGVGGQFSPAQNYFIQAGVRYMWLGDAKAKARGEIVGDFTNNNAWAYGMKIGYKF